MLVTLSFLIITAIVNHMDVLAQSAAVGLVERITGFIMLFPIAFQSAISAMTAQNMGAGRPDRARQGLKYGILFCLVADIAMFVLVQLVPGLAMRLFTPDAEVIYHGCSTCAPIASTAFWSPLCSPSTVFTAAAAAPASPCSTVWHPPSWYGYRRYFSSACSPVSLCCTSVWPRAASAVQVLLQLLYFRTGRWNHSVLGRRRHDRRSAGLPGRRSGPHFPL
ncbi:MATE family efflux transporter [Flavonifractor plautii]|nr:MATE family efflux transporter [Flavonifractor plautii]